MINVDGPLPKATIILRGLTYRKLAQRINITSNTLSNIILGKNKPSYDVMTLIMSDSYLSRSESADIFFAGPHVAY